MAKRDGSIAVLIIVGMKSPEPKGGVEARAHLTHRRLVLKCRAPGWSDFSVPILTPCNTLNENPWYVSGSGHFI